MKLLKEKQLGNVLLCTCHPDDEAMFFNPIIQYLLSMKVKVFLLCLSTGDYDGLGHIRKVELLKSCKVLGVELISVIDNPSLKDGWTEWTRDDCVLEIQSITKKCSIETLLTFDEKGISGHPNHSSLSKAIDTLQGQFNIIFLLTRPLFPFKYLAFLAPNHPSLETIRLAPFSKNFWKGIRAMFCHSSQLVSFRYFYLIFSSYMYTNIITCFFR